MKAPDKIYLEPYLDYPDKLHPSWYRYDIIGSGVEFIRKDALLEKLEKAAASYKKRSDEGELVWQTMCGIKEAISILNEM